jgi:hypothetical protein
MFRLVAELGGGTDLRVTLVRHIYFGVPFLFHQHGLSIHNRRPSHLMVGDHRRGR